MVSGYVEYIIQKGQEMMYETQYFKGSEDLFSKSHSDYLALIKHEYDADGVWVLAVRYDIIAS